MQRVKIEAEQEIEQAKAEAESYRLKNEQLTDMILLSDWIEKWDGHLPTVTGGDGSSMMLDISGLLEAYEQSGGSTTSESSTQAEE